MDQWIEVAKVYGPLAFIALALSVFLYRSVWPLVIKRLEDADKERVENARRMDEQSRVFSDTIRARDVLMADISERHVKALEALTIEVRKGNGKTLRKK